MKADGRLVLRRYAPLLAVLAVQLLFVAILPSTASDREVASGGGDGSDFESPFVTAPSGDEGPSAPPVTDASGAIVPGDDGPSTDGSGAPRTATTRPAGGGGGGGAGGGSAPGDTTHCVGGRQFDPAIDYFAPPCVAEAGDGNPGASYDGVTGDTITIVDYYPQGNAAVDSTLRAQGLYVSFQQSQQWADAVADFVNANYELYGRTVEIKVFQGGCSTIPPDTACLRNEMRRIVSTLHPFVFRWITPLTNEPFDELSNLGVINVGGQMFMDTFSTARRPYHWDVHMSGTRIAQHFGQFWCKQLAGKPAAHSASPAPDGTPGNTNGKTRVLGIIGTNDPENVKMRQEVDKILQSCGDRVAHVYDASNDLSTAAAQKSASVASMRQNPEATTVLCLCNPVGASFVYEEMSQQNYYPENLYAGTVYIDADESGQSFMGGAGCPTGTNCVFATAFGLSGTEPREPVGKDRAQRVWTASGRPGSPPFPGAEVDWDYYQLIASLLQGAGPNLNPANVEQGAFAAGTRGGGDTGHVLRGFAPGSYAWNQDMAISYFDPKKPSSFNGKPGTFVRLGKRITVGGYGPTLPAIPADR